MMSSRARPSMVLSTVRTRQVPIGAVIALAVVLGCGRGKDGGTGTAGSGNGGSAGTGAAGTTGRGGVGGDGAGAAGTMGAAGKGGTAASGGTIGAGGTGACAVACTTGRTCCGGGCVNLQNDPFNCGVCGRICDGNTPYCGEGTCQQPPCAPQAELCEANSICCGNTCCPVGDICCEYQGPFSTPGCYTPTATAPTCPQGCAPLCVSDRNQKKNIAPANIDAILRKVGELPISTWTYLNEPSTVRHLGPMAQDFHASFGFGDDDRTYNSIDAHGVALAAIQALDRVVSQQEQRIEKLERENRALEQRLRTLDGRHEPATR